MRLLADENIDQELIDWLRRDGHDVVSARDSAPGSSDHHWLETAKAESRLVLTLDKDFGDLLFRDQAAAAGVILLRLPGLEPWQRAARLAEVLDEIASAGADIFAVVSPDKLRIRRIDAP